MSPDPGRDPNLGLPITPPPGAVLFDRGTRHTPAPRDPTPPPTPRPVTPPGVAATPRGVAAGSAGAAPPQPGGEPVLQGSVRRPYSAVVAALSAVAVVLAIAIVIVVVVRQRDNPTSTPTPVLSSPETSISDVVTTVLTVPGEVPNVVGLATDEAEAALDSNGYRAFTGLHCYDRVAGQDPAGGTALEDGESVELLFEPCIVPDFVGQRLPAAISVIEDDIVVGLRISWPQHCDDLVIGQSIEPGTVVEPGTNIELELPTDC